MKQQIAPVRSGIVLACALFTTIAYVGNPSRAFAEEANTSASAIPQATALVFRFAVQSQSTNSAALFSQPCAEDKSNNNSASKTASKSDNLTIDPVILDAISNELQKRLSKKHMSVTIDPNPKSIPVGDFVVTGCIVKAHKGSSAGRIVGLGLGRSCLAAHVVLLLKTEAGLNSRDSFDLQVKGGSFMPPGPLTVAVNAATAKSQTLSGDGKKLADRIIKRLDTDSVFSMKAYPMVELKSGFPYQPLDVYQNFVESVRAQGTRFPTYFSADVRETATSSHPVQVELRIVRERARANLHGRKLAIDVTDLTVMSQEGKTRFLS